MPANEERSISLGQLQERPMKEPTSDTEGRYGDGAARTKVRRPKPKALLYHVCSNRIELLFQNGEHKVALVRSAIKQVAKRSAIGEEKGIEFAVEMMTSGLAKGRNASRQSSSATALPQNILNGLCQHGGRSSLPSYYSSTRGLPRCHLERRDQEEEKEKAVFCRFLTSLEKKLSCRHQGKGPRLYTAAEAESKGLVERSRLDKSIDESLVDRNEAIIKEMHDGLVRATTTASSLEAEQGSGNITKTQTKATSSGPSFPRTSSEGGPGEGNTSRSGEGSMQLLELINLCTKLSDKVTSLEDELASTKAVYNKALITLTKRVLVTSIGFGPLAFARLAELDHFTILPVRVILSEIYENLSKIDMYLLARG
ncbi:hypothetical protein Tco_0568972 [Tanacetum coccineum]